MFRSPPSSPPTTNPLPSSELPASKENIQPLNNVSTEDKQRTSKRTTKGNPPTKLKDYDLSGAAANSSQPSTSTMASPATDPSIDLLGGTHESVREVIDTNHSHLTVTQAAGNKEPSVVYTERISLDTANVSLSEQLNVMHSQLVCIMSQLQNRNAQPISSLNNEIASHSSTNGGFNCQIQRAPLNPLPASHPTYQEVTRQTQPSVYSSNATSQTMISGNVDNQMQQIVTNPQSSIQQGMNRGVGIQQTYPSGGTSQELGNQTSAVQPQLYQSDSNIAPQPTNIYNGSQSYADPYHAVNNSLSTPIYSYTNHHRPKLHDLPQFSGRPEEWPMFIASFNESTSAYGYTPLENMLRLQKSLRDDAKRAVESILINPRCVPAVIEELKTNFGRPERLIRSQMEKVRSWPVIPDNRLDLVTAFATKVQNLCTLLESLESQQHLANPMLLEGLISKLPLFKQLEWAQFSDAIQPYPSMRDFCGWLKMYAKFASIVHLSHRPVTGYLNKNNRQEKNNIFHAKENATRVHISNKNTQVCTLCSQSHNLSQCTEFQRMNVNDRWKFVKEKQICFACLLPGHIVSRCGRKKRCEKANCRRHHHGLLHETQNSNSPNQTSRNIDSNFHTASVIHKVLFKVLPVKLYGPSGVVSTYAFLDDGSSVSILNECIAKELGLKGRSHTMSLTWIGQKETSQLSTLVNLEISGIQEGSNRYALKNVRTHNDLSLPMQTMDCNEVNSEQVFKSLPISTYENAVPQILIGLDNWRLIIGNSSVMCEPEGPIAVQTLLGWVVYGGASQDVKKSKHIYHIDEDNNYNQDSLSQLVQEYFLMDNVDYASSLIPQESKENIRARKLLKETTVQLGNRFQTGLLWKTEGTVLPNSLPMAKKRLEAVQRVMKKDPEYAAEYESIIKGYLEKGYAQKMSAIEANKRGPRTWYLPHFCVRKSHKGGKLRLVFDAAAKVGEISLNSSLLKGPEQCQDMLAVLHKFRENPIGVCGDICEMFHQITIRKEDQDAQRFLWQHDDELETYVMKVMVFGATCSPCSAEYVKNLNAQRYADSCPHAVKAIIENHYVDDFVCSFANEEEALSVTNDVIRIHKAGGFELRKFASNSSRLLAGLKNGKSEQISVTNMDIANKTEKILGMHWNPSNDTFTFHLNIHQTSPEFFNGEHCPTKRKFLSIIMSIFDPFGLLADWTIHAKLMMQTLWKSKIKWEDEIPPEIQLTWRKWILTLEEVQRLRVSRCYSTKVNFTTEVQLHILVDASEEAFAAVAYWRFAHQDNTLSLAFVEGKTKCAPTKLLSIPRLELQAAVLGVRLRRRCLQSHNMKPVKCTFWSDSRTVLAWIKTADPRKYKPYVGHRIAEILELSDARDWRWIPTKLNTADAATRSKYLSKYKSGGKWISGPEFLLENESQWPMSSDETTSAQMPEEELRSAFRSDSNIFHVSNPDIDLTKFSNFLKLKRVMAWILRVLCKPSERPKHRILSVKEIEHAEIVLCRMVQKRCYWDEYATLQKGKPLDKSSHLYNLTPCLDVNGVIRLSGRIDFAKCIPIQSRRPIIMPKNSWFSKLIVKDVHETFHHQNHETILCEVRRRFWIPHLRTLVKMIARNCQECKNNQTKPLTPQMGQLPEDRLTPFVRPFTFTGVDYLGPVLVAIGRRREKRWIALFTCLTVRAVHLEIANDLSTDSFIICLRNFVNRRGIPIRIRSDNGTNFVGADKELKLKLDMFDQAAIEEYLSTKGIQWIFNCPSNPSAGGCWERLVRSVKRVLHVILKEVVPKEDTLRCALTEAENNVNSRPLTHVPVSHDEDEPLTPNHFILGCANSTQTPGLEENRTICLRKQWRIAQALKDRFWHRWIAEYLPDLTRRTKWFKTERPLAIGDLVIICESSVARSCWRRGRIVRVFPGGDGQVRSAEIQTPSGVLRRPASKLAKLDVGESLEAIHGGRDVTN